MREDRSLNRFPIAITILPTYTCTAACRDCCFQCSPDVRGRIPQDRLLQYITEASQIPSIKQIVFSGGECFVLGENLNEAVGYASQLGLLTRCVSNGYWARSRDAARERLRPLVDVGLDEMNYSTGDQHQRWVPVERVVHGASEALALGLNVAIVVEGHQGSRYTIEHLVAEPVIADILRDPERRRRLHLLQSPWITDAVPGADPEEGIGGDEAPRHPARGGCASVLSTLVLTPSEYVAACCGLTHEQIPEMRLGSLREHFLAELIEAGRRDFMKLWLLIEGPERILNWALEKDPSIQPGGPYHHHCDVCRAIYSHPAIRQILQDGYQEKIPDVTFRFALLDRAGLQRSTEPSPDTEPVGT
jgi:MoaA/NifB/PqqE/SkfB family radical SAM enzyme